MMVLVIGGSGSGKSVYAEQLLCLLAEEEKLTKYYLAAMQVFDEETKRKIERHKALRSGKGFLTIEQTVRIEEALLQMESGKKAVLLECISNLTANEMFADGRIRDKEKTVETVVNGVERLKKNVTHLVVVSNDVFADGTFYEPATMDYIEAMGEINQALAAQADRVVEIVAGIPVLVK